MGGDQIKGFFLKQLQQIFYSNNVWNDVRKMLEEEEGRGSHEFSALRSFRTIVSCNRVSVVFDGDKQLFFQNPPPQSSSANYLLCTERLIEVMSPSDKHRGARSGKRKRQLDSPRWTNTPHQIFAAFANDFPLLHIKSYKSFLPGVSA